jgi:hypothetical protein
MVAGGSACPSAVPSIAREGAAFRQCNAEEAAFSSSIAAARGRGSAVMANTRHVEAAPNTTATLPIDQINQLLQL